MRELYQARIMAKISNAPSTTAVRAAIFPPVSARIVGLLAPERGMSKPIMATKATDAETNRTRPLIHTSQKRL